MLPWNWAPNSSLMIAPRLLSRPIRNAEPRTNVNRVAPARLTHQPHRGFARPHRWTIPRIRDDRSCQPDRGARSPAPPGRPPRPGRRWLGSGRRRRDRRTITLFDLHHRVVLGRADGLRRLHDLMFVDQDGSLFVATAGTPGITVMDVNDARPIRTIGPFTPGTLTFALPQATLAAFANDRLRYHAVTRPAPTPAPSRKTRDTAAPYADPANGHDRRSLGADCPFDSPAWPAPAAAAPVTHAY